jgi:phage-related tail protein
MDTLRLRVELDAINKATGPLREVLKGTTALNKGVEEARRQLKGLTAQQKQLEGFRQAASRVAETAQAMQEASRRARDLRDSIIAAATPFQEPHRGIQSSPE